MGKKLKITIVGPGRLGTALAWALRQAGYELDEIVSRDRAESLRRARQIARRGVGRAVEASQAEMTADVIWICVGDRAIRECAESLAVRDGDVWKNRIIFHSSGALTSGELDSLRRRGAHVASVHPMMSFVHAAKPSLAGVTFAVEGDSAAVRVARRIVRDLNGNILSVAKEQKAMYHAWGAFASPLIIAELAVADRVARDIGISPAKARKTLAPILRQTIENYVAHGPAAAFSGPIVRGDLETVQRHLIVLKKVAGAREVYMALARAATKELPTGRRAELRALLGIVEPRNRKAEKS